MSFKKNLRAFFPRHDVDSTGPVAATLGRGAGRRANRARHLALEVMEERHLLSTVLPTLTSITTTSGSTTNVLVGPPFSGDPHPFGPGVQPSGDVGCATFTLPSNYSGPDIRVGLADYTSPGSGPGSYPPTLTPAGELQYLNAHVYFDSSSAVIGVGHLSATVCVNLAHCQPGQEFTQELDAFYYKDPTTNLPTTSAPNNNGGLVTNFVGSDYYGYFNYLTHPGTPENLLGGSVVDCTAANAAGAFSQGYYKNHPDALPLTMAIGNQLYTRDELVTLLETPPSGGDATLINVHQLITAYANEENGTPLTTDVSNAIMASQAIFDTLPILIDGSGNYNTAATVKASTATGTTLVNEASILETFNP